MTFKTTHLLAALTLVASAGAIAPMPASAAETSAHVFVEDAQAKKGKTVVGTIVSMDLANNVFTVKTNAQGEKDKTIEVTVNDDTAYMVGKETSTQDAVLKQGAKVRVKHKDAVALSVTLMPEGDGADDPKKPDKPEKPKKPKKPKDNTKLDRPVPPVTPPSPDRPVDPEDPKPGTPAEPDRPEKPDKPDKPSKPK